MNTNDLPPAAKLAALIEAGRAANPDVKHGRGNLFYGGEACALGFAALGKGVSRGTLSGRALASALLPEYPSSLRCAVMVRNDFAGASLDDIIRSLREGELAKVPA